MMGIIRFLFNKVNYKKFNKKQAEKWAVKNYKSIEIPENVMTVIAEYCKENEPIVNHKLRINLVTDEVMGKIQILDEFLDSYSIDQSIVVFRLINFNPFLEGNKYTEKGFMSTSLVNGDINVIHNHEYRLKIHLSKGTKGFYVDYISCREGEYEFLLPRKTTITYINDYLTKDNRHEIECYVS